MAATVSTGNVQGNAGIGSAAKDKPRPRPKFKAENEHDRCVACGVCVKVCPKDAISIYKGCYALLTVVYRPRTWCVFCPMGNMTQMICKIKKGGN